MNARYRRIFWDWLQNWFPVCFQTGSDTTSATTFDTREVFKALRQIEHDLKPVFDAAPSNAWETPMQQYTTLSTREKMLELHRQGVKAPEIARRFGKSSMTVYRLIERRQDRETAGDH